MFLSVIVMSQIIIKLLKIYHPLLVSVFHLISPLGPSSGTAAHCDWLHRLLLHRMIHQSFKKELTAKPVGFRSVFVGWLHTISHTRNVQCLREHVNMYFMKTLTNWHMNILHPVNHPLGSAVTVTVTSSPSKTLLSCCTMVFAPIKCWWRTVDVK